MGALAKKTDDIAYERGLPGNLETERLVLGAILTIDMPTELVKALIDELNPANFTTETHRRIYQAIKDTFEERGEVDRVSLADMLKRRGQLESVGIGTLAFLDDGIPRVFGVKSHIKSLKGYTATRQLIAACDAAAQRCFQGDDAARVIEGLNRNIERVGSGLALSEAEFYDAGLAIERYDGGLDAFLSEDSRKKGTLTGFAALDRLTLGLQPGEVFVVAARPGMGKTAFANRCGEFISMTYKKPVLNFNLEMSKESQFKRMIVASAMVDAQRFKRGELNSEERRKLAMAAHRFTEAPFYIEDNPVVTINDIQRRSMAFVAKYGTPGLIIIDYLQLITPEGRAANREQEVSGISRGIKIMAKELKVPVMVLAQLSREPEKRQDKRPQLSDLRESGSVEQDADIVGFIYRDEYYQATESNQDMAELIVAKQRNGPTGKADLAYIKASVRFDNLPDEASSAL